MTNAHTIASASPVATSPALADRKGSCQPPNPQEVRPAVFSAPHPLLDFPVDKARSMARQLGVPTQFESLRHAKLSAHEEFPEAFAEHTARFLQAPARTAS